MISVITSVWTSIVSFLTTTFGSITELFVDTSGSTPALTLVGTLGVIMAGVALILLVFNIIRSFLVMRG